MKTKTRKKTSFAERVLKSPPKTYKRNNKTSVFLHSFLFITLFLCINFSLFLYTSKKSLSQIRILTRDTISEPQSFTKNKSKKKFNKKEKNF